MLIGMEEIIHDHLALMRVPETLLRQEFLKDFVDTRDVPLPSCGPGREKDELFSGDRGHSLLKLSFNSMNFTGAGSRMSVFFFDDVQELKNVVHFEIGSG